SGFLHPQTGKYGIRRGNFAEGKLLTQPLLGIGTRQAKNARVSPERSGDGIFELSHPLNRSETRGSADAGTACITQRAGPKGAFLILIRQKKDVTQTILFVLGSEKQCGTGLQPAA